MKRRPSSRGSSSSFDTVSARTVCVLPIRGDSHPGEEILRVQSIFGESWKEENDGVEGYRAKAI